LLVGKQSALCSAYLISFIPVASFPAPHDFLHIHLVAVEVPIVVWLLVGLQMIGLSTGWIGTCSLAPASTPAIQLMDTHDFVPPGVNHLHCHTFVLSCRERK